MTKKTHSAQTDLHEQILKLVASEVEANPVSYNAEIPYQSYERVGFEGMRWSVEKRIREYGLEQFYGSEAAVLDIGSNFGFFVCEFALHCKLAHGIEPNSHLNKIGEITAEYLGISDQVKFHDCYFDAFESDVQFDTIFSLAAFYTGDGRERSDANDYFSKVSDMLAPGGRIFYESTSYTKDPDGKAYNHCVAAESAVTAMKEILDLEREWETPSGSIEFNRRFAIARKKDA
jgi:hypothetical protein